MFCPGLLKPLKLKNMEVFTLTNDSLTNFIAKYGVEPSGLLMSEYTFQLLKSQVDLTYLPFVGSEPTHIHGILIYRSNQMENNVIKFVI